MWGTDRALWANVVLNLLLVPRTPKYQLRHKKARRDLVTHRVRRASCHTQPAALRILRVKEATQGRELGNGSNVLAFVFSEKAISSSIWHRSDIERQEDSRQLARLVRYCSVLVQDGMKMKAFDTHQKSSNKTGRVRFFFLVDHGTFGKLQRNGSEYAEVRSVGVRLKIT